MYWKKLLGMVIVLLTIYVGFLFFSDLEKIQEIITEIGIVRIFIATLPWIAIAIITSLRWHYFLQTVTSNISFKQSMLYYLAGYALVISPGGAGETIRSPLMKKEFNVKISNTVSLVFMERFYDLLGVTIIISVSLAFSNFEKTIILLPLSLMIFLFILIKNKNLFLTLIQKISNVKFLKKITPAGEESHTVMFNLIKPKYLLVGSSVSVINGLLAVISMSYLLLVMNSPVNFYDLATIFHTSNFIAVISLVPGGIGVLEGGLIGLLVLYDVQYEIAVSVSILLRLMNTGILTIVGLICLSIIFKKFSQKKP